jgi:hypothetical protein
MSRNYYPAEAFNLLTGSDSLSIYRFPPHKVNHYFCRHCGIYPFHDGVANPGVYRINLGCVDEINPHELPVRVFDGLDSWQFLN